MSELRAVPKPPKTPKKAPKPLQRYTALRPVRKGKDPRQPTLKSHRSKPSPPTAAHHARWDAAKLLGCVACRIIATNVPPRRKNDQALEIHHLNEGGAAGRKRRGHEFTICLCRWHHQGELPRGMREFQAEMQYGPSLKRASKRFRETFGTDDQLLEYQNRILEGE